MRRAQCTDIVQTRNCFYKSELRYRSIQCQAETCSRLPITLTHTKSGGDLEMFKSHLNLIKTQTRIWLVR